MPICQICPELFGGDKHQVSIFCSPPQMIGLLD